MGNSASEVRTNEEEEDLSNQRYSAQAGPSSSSTRSSPLVGSAAIARRLPAVESLDSSPSGNKSDAAQANAQGVKLLNSGQYEDAIRRFKLALSFEPGSVQILDNIGLAYAKMQDFTSAYEWYEKAHEQDPHDVETLFSLAWVERKRTRYLHARELFLKVLDIDPDHVKALWLLGDILKTSHDYEGGIRYFERLVRTDPKSVDGHISLAQCFEATKQYSKASQILSYVLQHLTPGRLDVQFSLGKVYYLQKQYRHAVAQLDPIPDSDSRGFEARTYAAKAYRELEDHDSAIVHAERAAQVRPHPDVMFFLGEEFLRLGEQQKAAHWFGRSLELDPNHLLSITELGQMMYRQSRWSDAEQHFTRLCELDRTDVSAVRWLALVKYKLKKDESCRQCCDAVLRVEPLNVDALWLLAELQVKNGSNDERWYLNLRLPPEVPMADVCQAIAKGYLIRKLLPEATAWLKKVQHYVPSENRVREALKLLTTEGHSVNPQDVIDILEQRSQASRASRWRSDDIESSNGTPSRRAWEGAGTAEVQDLERLLRRAERGGGQVPSTAEAQWKEVLSSAKSMLRRRPDDALALRCAARALLSIGGDPTEIREYARQAMEYGDEAAGFTLGYELHAYLGVVHERELNLSAAEKHFSAALSSKPGDEVAMLGLARTLLQRRETQKARQLYEQVVSSNPNCLEGLVKLSGIALKDNNSEEAYRFAVQAAKVAPSDPTVLALVRQASSAPGTAEKTSNSKTPVVETASVQAISDDWTAWKATGHAHRKNGRTEEAIACYKNVLDTRPHDFDSNLGLAQVFASKGTSGASQALHYFRTAIQCGPSMKDAREIYLQMANVQTLIKAWKDAQQTLEGAVREFPEDVEIWQKLLTIYEQQKDSKGQHHVFKRLAQLGSMTSAMQVAYAELLMSDGQLRDARVQLEQVLRTEPENIAALLKLAASWRQDPSRESNLEEARRCYEKLLRLSPNHAEALEGAAYCHRKVNNLDQAILLYQQCLKVKATAEGPLYYLGDILYKQHRHAECQLYLSRLIETNCATDYKIGALYLLAKSHVSLDEYEEAERQARSGLALKANHPHFLFILALVKNRMADYDSSITTLKKALQHCDAADSEHLKVEIRDWLAQAYERKHDYAAANAELDQALKQDPNHVSSLITRGQVQIQLKQLDQAEISFHKALTVEKNHALALVRLGYCKLLANDYQEATMLFQRALQQRCGTVALPRSVKGCARIYMSLALMGQQDMSGALLQLTEARKSHRSFDAICSSGKDGIVKGDCEGLVTKLRGMSDLDVNLAQAWQLVELMAKELEMDLRENSQTTGPSSSPAHSPSSARGAQSPTAAPSPHDNGVPATQNRKWLSAEVATPSDRREWVSSATPAVAPATAQREWTAPVSSPPVAATAPTKEPVAKPMTGGPLKLLEEEQIDFSELTTKECLGVGGFGAVYRGYFNGREVAIKKLFVEDAGDISPLQLEELEKEVAVLRSLGHIRLVTFIGACLSPPNLCIVTEFMAGGSLHHLLHKAKTPLTLGQQAKMALQVCEGVAFLHGNVPPVVHRDLKSLNVILDRLYNAKICDFGLTQSMDKTHISLKEGGNGGSPRYMAPECYDCKGKITDKVDVWALGCILVEVFGGPLPYDDCNNIQQIVAKVLIDKQIPYIPNHLPTGVRPIIEDCFRFDIKERTSSNDVYSRMKKLELAPVG